MERDLFNYSRRETSEVNIGAVPLGGPHPIRIQSMTNTSTQDTEACVEQAKRIVDAGGEYVRLTTQGIKEAENLMNINIGLRSQGYMVPLVADVHFNPKVALLKLVLSRRLLIFSLCSKLYNERISECIYLYKNTSVRLLHSYMP